MEDQKYLYSYNPTELQAALAAGSINRWWGTIVQLTYRVHDSSVVREGVLGFKRELDTSGRLLLTLSWSDNPVIEVPLELVTQIHVTPHPEPEANNFNELSEYNGLTKHAVYLPQYGGTGPVLVVEEIETLPSGGVQSLERACISSVPLSSLEAVMTVFYEGGRKYGVKNYLLIPSQSSIDHAVLHCIKALKSLDDPDKRASVIEDLSHAACRCMMALEVILEESKK